MRPSDFIDEGGKFLSVFLKRSKCLCLFLFEETLIAYLCNINKSQLPLFIHMLYYKKSFISITLNREKHIVLAHLGIECSA